MSKQQPPKSRYTNDLTYAHYRELARIGAPNPHCPVGGRLTYTEFTKEVDRPDGTSELKFNGCCVHCTCGNKWDCFRAGPASKKQPRPRISSHVLDVDLPQVLQPLVIKRRRAV